ncbi:class I SAM-dependent methyltransferase [Nitratidesulfovibrio sp. SRB-5]|uniref:class I SAM-dependent methyltransferase n=1 Tax=Nitratidesulfovibrio sp. SRB-5 TaxID=2872636 RepID=UPI001027BA44|nr:class I SAM-dependent methyltransferase [Nitratidesulfovibrio sp. SRB-5]MBZ2170712.1 class I SAM-dependent methyltransferase [Nitratidesulfovibrio sp. SRB-5]RXF76927.1 class I SAM-dependent methyltransferase [Desulfovibrio sp. DS-1]
MPHNTTPHPADTLNLASYDAVAPQWDRARHAFYGREQAYLDLLLEEIAPAVPGDLHGQAKTRPLVLDAGCGTGRPMAEYVLRRGCDVLGIDQSPAMVEVARQHFPQARWRVTPLEAYPFDEACHAVILWDCLFHIPRARHADILSGAVRALRPGGRLMLTAGGSAHPAFTDTMFDREFFYDSHPPERVADMLRGLSCHILLHEFMNLPTGGREKGRCAFVVRKAG